MDLIQGSGNNPGRDRWVVATGRIMGQVEGPCHLATMVHPTGPAPTFGHGIKVVGVDLGRLPDLRRHGAAYWTEGSYQISGFIDENCVLNATRVMSSTPLTP